VFFVLYTCITQLRSPTEYLRIDHDLEKLADVPLVIDGDRLPLRVVSETKAYNQLCKIRSKNAKVNNHSSEEEEEEEEEEFCAPPAQSHSRSSHASGSGTSNFSKRPTAPLPSRADPAIINPRPAKRRRTDDDEDVVYNLRGDHPPRLPNAPGHVTNHPHRSTGDSIPCCYFVAIILIPLLKAHPWLPHDPYKPPLQSILAVLTHPVTQVVRRNNMLAKHPHHAKSPAIHHSTVFAPLLKIMVLRHGIAKQKLHIVMRAIFAQSLHNLHQPTTGLLLLAICQSTGRHPPATPYTRVSMLRLTETTHVKHLVYLILGTTSGAKACRLVISRAT
jgi:hypothetical protein